MNFYDHQKKILTLIDEHQRLHIESERNNGITTILLHYAVMSANEQGKSILYLTNNIYNTSVKLSNLIKNGHNVEGTTSNKRYKKFVSHGSILIEYYDNINYLDRVRGRVFDQIIIDGFSVGSLYFYDIL